MLKRVKGQLILRHFCMLCVYVYCNFIIICNAWLHVLVCMVEEWDLSRNLSDKMRIEGGGVMSKMV